MLKDAAPWKSPNTGIRSLCEVSCQPIYATHWVRPICRHYGDVIMGAIASQITSLTIVYSIVYSADQRKHQSSASLAFVWGIHRGSVNSPHKWPVTRNMFPFDDVIMCFERCTGRFNIFNIAHDSLIIIITIITCHFQFHVVNVSMLRLKYKYGTRSKSRFACHSASLKFENE